uniref:Uncharacterized protein n=1 Tax=Octopus bimaculoides TaxID=37653 RepID=A0A0L8H047_OCTBM
MSNEFFGFPIEESRKLSSAPQTVDFWTYMFLASQTTSPPIPPTISVNFQL